MDSQFTGALIQMQLVSCFGVLARRRFSIEKMAEDLKVPISSRGDWRSPKRCRAFDCPIGGRFLRLRLFSDPHRLISRGKQGLPCYIQFMAEQSEVPQNKSPHQTWARPVIWTVVVLALAVNGVIVFRSCRNLPIETLEKTAKVIDHAGKAWSDIAAAFKQGTITTSFISYATTIGSHQRLQFATLKQNEIFTRSEQSTTGFGYIPLPEVVVEARAPVEYTYYLDLNAEWRFVLEDNVVHVFAPPIRFNTPSVDVSAITHEVKKGYVKTTEAQENLRKSIQSLAILRAKENISLVRETGRRQVTEFVENWLMKSFPDGKQYPVKVFFPGEKLSAGSRSTLEVQPPLERNTK